MLSDFLQFSSKMIFEAYIDNEMISLSKKALRNRMFNGVLA